jgi:hypothetical protein
MARRAPLVAALAVLVVGCSSGSGKLAGKYIERNIHPHYFAATTTAVSPQVVANLGRCPKTSLAAQDLISAKFNAGIRNLATKLVPINVESVRICAYQLDSGVLHDVVLNGSQAVQFTDDTNEMRASLNLTTCPPGLSDVVIFANSTEHVSLFDYCGNLGNGVFAAEASLKWFNELLCYSDYGVTAPRSCLVHGPSGPSG